MYSFSGNRMRLKPLHTIWLTLLTTLILLVSSVANSAPLMNLKMMQRNTMASAEMIAYTNAHCGSHNMEMGMPMPSMSVASDMANTECSDSSGMVHNCCTAACSLVFVSLPVLIEQPYPQTYRATIHIETAQPVVQVTHDLYRPPIA